MAKPHHDWFLREWLKATRKRQADIVKDLDWNKSRVSLMIAGKQQYTRDAVNELADWLHIRPHELLMHPDDAQAAKRLRAEMIRLAAEQPPEEFGEPTEKVSLG